MTSFDPFPFAPHHIPDRPIKQKDRAARPHLPIPDLRFEQSFLRSIEKYVHVEGASRRDEKGKEKDDMKAVTHTEGPIVVGSLPRVSSVDWGPVLWITFRDQVFSPWAQGALWAVIAYYLTPTFKLLGVQVRNFFSPSPNARRLRQQGWGVQGLQGRFR